MVEGREPRRHRGPRRSYYTGIELVEASDDNRPLLVGERTNEVGSRAFKRLITEEKFEEAAEIGRKQVRNGAQIIDINLENPDRDELTDIDRFYEKVIHKVKAPLMIDTTNSASVERALTYCLGKSIINSINFEDGEERFHRVLPLVKKYGAAIVIGSIDEDKQQAQAITRERKLAIAERAYKYCIEEWGLPAEDLIFDPLVFPCGTGDENYIGSAVETIEGVRLDQGKPAGRQDDSRRQQRQLRHADRGARGSQLGLPLPRHARPGSTWPSSTPKSSSATRPSPRRRRSSPKTCCGTIRPQATTRRATTASRRASSERGSINSTSPASPSISATPPAASKKTIADLPIDERLANYIIEGTKEGLIPDLDQKLKDGVAPLDIINGPLMDGMKEVGRLFNNNELIVAEVLQSAEAMKAAVAHLEQFMEKKPRTRRKARSCSPPSKATCTTSARTSSTSFSPTTATTVINLGIKVPPEELIKAYREHKPDAIGLSGLLVKSAQQMVITAGDLQRGRHHRPDAGRRRGAERPLHAPQDRAGLCAVGLLRQRRHDRPEPDEPADGPGRARSRRAGASSRSWTKPPRSRPSKSSNRPRAAHACGSTCRRTPFPTASVSCATCRSCGRSGATSTRRCSTSSTWASKAISSARWPSAIPRRWSSTRSSRTSKPKPRSS